MEGCDYGGSCSLRRKERPGSHPEMNVSNLVREQISFEICELPIESLLRVKPRSTISKRYDYSLWIFVCNLHKGKCAPSYPGLVAAAGSVWILLICEFQKCRKSKVFSQLIERNTSAHVRTARLELPGTWEAHHRRSYLQKLRIKPRSILPKQDYSLQT